MRLFIFGCLPPVALCLTAGRGATMEQERLNEAEEDLTAADLEYRPWQRGDARYGQPSEPPDPDRLFVAADPKAASGYNVVGRVESELQFTDENNPKFAAAFPHAAIVRISYVWVHVAWRSKRVASTMFPKALEDVNTLLLAGCCSGLLGDEPNESSSFDTLPAKQVHILLSCNTGKLSKFELSCCCCLMVTHAAVVVVCLANCILASASSGGSLLRKLQGRSIRRTINASELEYRPWKAGDMRSGNVLPPVESGRRFVAVDPKAEKGHEVLGVVESELGDPNRSIRKGIESILPGLLEDGTLIRIPFVRVHSRFQNRGIASKMLPEALEDIRQVWPNVVAAYLEVEPTNQVAMKLYTKAGFTLVPRSRGDKIMLYKYPPR
ncbi:hypothetical protein FOZ60_008863 [Perkinsus olseni]|uniref:N-acetyltransferase domain-containing protein n=1 Tax=Perkinsus olseni TaxID=32597 RepID=A0A7J6NIL0_PEROL|nr:hypothetical protein FOZ60_008863 [Perkinsus olseni]